MADEAARSGNHASYPGTTRHWFRGGDGTRLAWYEAGRADGPPMVLLSGLGGGFGIWRPFVERFRDHLRLIGWDYRGLYASDAPSDPDAFTMDHHVADLSALLRHADVDAPILVGWSMGVQLALELHREPATTAARSAPLPRALIGVHGTAGRPLATAFDSRFSPYAVPPVLHALRRVRRGFSGYGPGLVDAPGVARAFTLLCRGLGLMTPGVDVDAFRDMAREWVRLDFDAYAKTFLRLGDHDASDLLPGIDTPTLLVAGGRDPLTPARLAEQMARTLRNAELALLPDATHFGLLEQPDAITAHAARFLRERLGIEVGPATEASPEPAPTTPDRAEPHVRSARTAPPSGRRDGGVPSARS